MSPVPVAAAPVWGWMRVRALVLHNVASPHSRRVYAEALDDFWEWSQQSGPGGFNRETVQQYRGYLEGRDLAFSTRNLHLTVIRKLAREAAAHGICRRKPLPTLPASLVRGRKASGLPPG